MASASRLSLSLKLRSAENLKLNTVGQAGWSMLGELGDLQVLLEDLVSGERDFRRAIDLARVSAIPAV